MLNKVDRVIEKESTEEVVKAYQLKFAQHIYEAGTQHYLQQPFRRDHLARLGETTLEQAEIPVLESFEADCLQYQTIYKEELYNVGRVNKVRLLAEQQHLSLGDAVAKQLAKTVRQEFHLACDVYRELYAADLRDDGQLDYAVLATEQARWNLGQSIVEAIAATEQSTFTTDQQEYHRIASESLHQTGQLVNRPLHPLQIQFSFGTRLLAQIHGEIEQEFQNHLETYQQQFLDILRHNGAISDAARHQLEELRQRLGNIHPSLLVDFEANAIETHEHNVTAYTDEAYQVIQQFTDGNIHEPTPEEQESLVALSHWYNLGPSIAAQIEQTVRAELAAQQPIAEVAGTVAIADTRDATSDVRAASLAETSETEMAGIASENEEQKVVTTSHDKTIEESVEGLGDEAIAQELTTAVPEAENTVPGDNSALLDAASAAMATEDPRVLTEPSSQEMEDPAIEPPASQAVTSEEEAWNALIQEANRETNEDTLDMAAPAPMTVISLSDEPTVPFQNNASDRTTIQEDSNVSLNQSDLEESADQASIIETSVNDAHPSATSDDNLEDEFPNTPLVSEPEGENDPLDLSISNSVETDITEIDSPETNLEEENSDILIGASVDIAATNSVETEPISDASISEINRDEAGNEERTDEIKPVNKSTTGNSNKPMLWGTVLVASAVLIGGAIAFLRGPGQEQPVPSVDVPSTTVEIVQGDEDGAVVAETTTNDAAEATDTEDLPSDPMVTLTAAQQLIQDRQVVSALEQLATVPQNDDTLFEVEGVLRQVVQQAEAYYREGLYDEAITVIDTLSELFPRQPITKEAVIASREWQNRWHANLATLKVAEDALEKEEFDSAIAEAQKVKHPGLQVEVATIIDTAIQAKQEAALLAEQARQNRQNRVPPAGSPAPRESVAPQRTAPAPAPRSTPQPARPSVTPSPSPSYYSPDPL